MTKLLSGWHDKASSAISAINKIGGNIDMISTSRYFLELFKKRELLNDETNDNEDLIITSTWVQDNAKTIIMIKKSGDAYKYQIMQIIIDQD